MLQKCTDHAKLVRSLPQRAFSEADLSCRLDQVALSYRAVLEPCFQQPFRRVRIAGMISDVAVDDVVGCQVAQVTQRRKRDELVYRFAVKAGSSRVTFSRLNDIDRGHDTFTFAGTSCRSGTSR